MSKQIAKKIDGKLIAEKILLDLKAKITKLKRPPGLAVILIGNDSASQLYVRNKKKASQKIGIEFHDYLCGGKCYPHITENEILQMIDFLNADQTVDGIIVQLPIPKKFDSQKIINRISPQKDVDGFHPQNKKNFLASKPGIIPPLMQAINEALIFTGENLKGKEAVIVVNNPIYSETRKKEFTDLGLKVKITKPGPNLANETRKADVLVVILGQKNLIKKSMVKPGAIVIDVGTNLISKNNWTGDVDPKVAQVAGWLTPVPGGIGPMTVAFLLKNTYEQAKNKLQ
ncbi:MAG: bifunctional 5,10-methylenetetrahydrofolate dehydrogenase/5,10-methenyltetrahydrofolate cyclohydrolase [Patescibacteria group bacterium]